MTEDKFKYTMPHPGEGQKVEYNSTRETLKLPEYGRLVQEMVEYALTLTDRAERQRYAEAIIEVMAGLNPKMVVVPLAFTAAIIILAVPVMEASSKSI
jgi:hypothetical protein